MRKVRRCGASGMESATKKKKTDAELTLMRPDETRVRETDSGQTKVSLRKVLRKRLPTRNS